MIESEELYTRLSNMTEQERIDILDPICLAVTGKINAFGEDGPEVSANRILALAVLDLYREWQIEIYSRE
jgi:hypothetical protein